MGGGGGGSGGGGSPAPAPFVRTPDTLRSEDTLEVILALGEGEFEGLENGLQSIFIGDTPLANLSGNLNFSDFSADLYPGAETAVPITPFLGGQASNINVNTQLEQNVAVVRQLTVSNVTHIDLRFVWQSLYTQDDKGIYTTSDSLIVELKKSTTATWTAAQFYQQMTISGKTTSTYVKEIRIAVPEVLPEGVFWQVRITKASADSDGDLRSSLVSWESIQEVINTAFEYDNLAVLHILGRASNQFTSVPQFSSIVKGRRVRIPSNYDPVTRVYSPEPWDGIFQWGWTDNPAWILYDFVTNETFGLSYIRPIFMDKYAVYDAAKWCDTLVSDGAEGMEPRYTFNANINTARSAWDQARFIAGTFHGTLVDDNAGTLILQVDDNRDAIHLFTPENVTAEGFTYSYTDSAMRYNEIKVSFINPDLNWQEDRRIIRDDTSINNYGRVPHEFIAHGCLKESEALRRAYYRMSTALTEKEMVAFKTNRLGRVVNPMDIILVADPNQGYGLSGRVQSINLARTEITLRDPVYLEAGIDYTITFVFPEGLETREISMMLTGEVTTIPISPALPSDVPEKCTFSIEQTPGTGVGAPKPYRVLKVTENESIDHLEITALEINRNKFSASEALVVVDGVDYSGLGDPLDIPSPLSCTFTNRYDKGSDSVWVIVEPVFDPIYKFYSGEFDVYSRPTGSGGAFEKQVVYYRNTLINHPSGSYEFKILPKSMLGLTPPVANMESFTHIVEGADELAREPLAPENVEVTPLLRGFMVNWTMDPGEVGFIHSYVIKEGLTEETATELAPVVRDQFYIVDPMAKRSYTLWLYAKSIAFTLSEPTSVSYTNEAPAAPTNIQAHVAYETISITFDRNADIDIIGYRIQYRKVGQTTWLDMSDNGVFSNGEPNTAYEFRVAAIDRLTSLLNDEVWSTPVSAVTRNTLDVEQGLNQVREATTVNLIRNGSFERDLQGWTVE